MHSWNTVVVVAVGVVPVLVASALVMLGTLVHQNARLLLPPTKIRWNKCQYCSARSRCSSFCCRLMVALLFVFVEEEQ